MLEGLGGFKKCKMEKAQKTLFVDKRISAIHVKQKKRRTGTNLCNVTQHAAPPFGEASRDNGRN